MGGLVGAVSRKAEATSRGARMLRTALGPAINGWLEDPTIVEVMLNPDGRLWIDRLAGGLADTGERLSAADGERIVAICLAPRSPHAQHTKRRRLADLHRRKFPVSKRKQGDFPRITGRRLSTNGQSLSGIRDLDNFSKGK